MFPVPTEITATSGLIVARNDADVEVLLPWCPTFRTVVGLNEEAICFTRVLVLLGMSPARRKEVLP